MCLLSQKLVKPNLMVPKPTQHYKQRVLPTGRYKSIYCPFNYSSFSICLCKDWNGEKNELTLTKNNLSSASHISCMSEVNNMELTLGDSMIARITLYQTSKEMAIWYNIRQISASVLTIEAAWVTLIKKISKFLRMFLPSLQIHVNQCK